MTTRLQIEWSTFRYDVSTSVRPSAVRGRFRIFRTTEGYTTIDRVDQVRTETKELATARAWAGVRAGETVVRHS